MLTSVDIPTWEAVKTVLIVTPDYIFYWIAGAYALVLFLRSRWWFRVAGIFAISVALMNQLHIALQLDQGICIAQGRKMTEQEKVDGAVREILRAYPPLFRVGEKLARPPKPIPYADVAEFHRLNPGCCEFKLALSFEEITDASARIHEEQSGYVRARFLVRYADDSGVRREVPFKWELPVSHCATVVLTDQLYFPQ